MSTEFSVKFGDDFTDYIDEQVVEAVGNTDFSDHVKEALRYSDADDYFDMSTYDQQDEVRELERGLGDVEGEVEGLKKALVALVTALAEAGIVAKPKPQETTYTVAV